MKTVRTKLTLLLLGLTLVPFFTVGRIVYRLAEEALRQSLGSSFERMAAETIDKVDRSLFEVQESVQTWAQLEVMQEVLTGDLDGRIASFLIGINAEYKDFNSIDAIDGTGEIVASTETILVGTSLAEASSFWDAVRKRPLVQDISQDERTGAWVVLFCYPIEAQFDDRQTIGVLCARWNAGELARMTRVAITSRGVSEAETILVRRDGLVISAPTADEPAPFGDNLLEAGWQSAVNASDGKGGFVVETIPGHGDYLVGYSPSNGHRDFLPMGWSALVLQDLESAFAPVYELELIVLVVGTLVAAIVIVLSFVIGHRVTQPLVQMAGAAKRVADGDFDARVDHHSGDEMGSLARGFNRMIRDLKTQRGQLVEDIAQRKHAEKELREANAVAEESTARFKAVLNTMSEGVVTVDQSGTLVMANEEVHKIWGFSASELIGQSVEMLIPAREWQRYQAAFGRYVNQRRSDPSHIRLETEGVRKDGTAFPLEVSAAKTWIGDRVLVTIALRDITERKRAEEQITSALAEKEALLKEIHHRVKNNLQVIVSLLHLQSDHIKDEAAHDVFLDSETRVKSMALMHEKLYRSKDLSRIAVADYIGALTVDLSRSYRLTSSDVELTLDVEDLVLGMDTAIHCGLLVNELVSNALKHAFPKGRQGEVTIELKRDSAETFRLIVRDDGVGLPEDVNIEGGDTLGLHLVTTLVAQLDGTMDIKSGNGTVFTILFHDIDEPS